MYSGFFSAEDATLELFVAEFQFGADHLSAEFTHDALGVIELLLGDRQHSDLVGRQPEREVASIMLDEKTDEALMGPERGAVNAKRSLVRVVLVAIDHA